MKSIKGWRFRCWTSQGIWHAGLTSEGCCWRSGCHECTLSLCRDDWDVGWVGNHVSAPRCITFIRPATCKDSLIFFGCMWLPTFSMVIEIESSNMFQLQHSTPNPAGLNQFRGAWWCFDLGGLGQCDCDDHSGPCRAVVGLGRVPHLQYG